MKGLKVMIETYDGLKKGTAKKAQARVDYRAGRHGWDWCRIGAIAGLSGGIIAVALGSLLTASSWLTGAGSSYVQTMGTIFLLMTIPLLVFGAHCLDLIERRKIRARELRFRDKN